MIRAGFCFDWVGFSEINKYASSVYRRHYHDSKELGDIKSIQLKGLPDKIDLVTAGFPCQSFSIAGKRRGFNDTRGTLFFEIARVLRYFKEHKKPIPYFILENVKGLLSHDNGRTFITIYGILTDIGYTVECQVLNTRWFLPQNRERIFIVGCLRELGRPEVFPIGEGNKDVEDNGKRTMIRIGNSQDQKLSPINGNSQTLNSGHFNQPKIAVALTESRTEEAKEIRRKSQKKGRDYCPRRDKQLVPRNDNYGNCVTANPSKEGLIQIGQVGEHDNMGQRIYNPNGIACSIRSEGGGEKELPCLRGSAIEHNDFLKQGTLIRRLTPIECERLQGFSDNWTKYGKDNELISDTQRYKMLGNAVSVPVVEAVGKRLLVKIRDKR